MTEPVVPDVVRERIQESQKIKGWIGKLSEHADESYPDVTERVKSDYRKRLEGVAEHLRKDRADLLGNLEGRKNTVDSLRADRGSHASDLEEMRLRHVVGEFSDKEWDSRRETIEDSLEEVDSLLEVEDYAVAELSGVIATIGDLVPEVPKIAHVSEPSVGGDVKPASAKPPSWSTVLSEMPAEPEADEDEADDDLSDDELAFLETVSPEDVSRLDPVAAMLGMEPRNRR